MEFIMMKLILAVALISISLCSFSSFAEDKKASDNADQAQQQPEMKPEAFDKQMAKIQENIKLMNEQMTKIQKTQNPDDRQKLLNEHWKVMQDSMEMMHGMWGTGGMGCCMGNKGMMHDGMADHMQGGMMNHGMMNGGNMHESNTANWHNAKGYYSGMTQEQQGQHQYMMDKYMSTQMMMMDNMMQHQQWIVMPPSQSK
jgi:hypothetical protein